MAYNFLFLSDRIKYLVKTKGFSVSKIAKAGGIKSPSVSSMLAGKTKNMSAPVALNISRKLGVSLEWLVDGEGEPDMLEITPSSGVKIGPLNEAAFEVNMNISEDWFKNHGIIAKNCRSFVVEEDGMAPIVIKGDEIAVDTSDKELSDNSLYLFKVQDRYFVRRARRSLKGDTLLIGTNSTDTFSPEEFKGVEVMGKVVYLSRSVL